MRADLGRRAALTSLAAGVTIHESASFPAAYTGWRAGGINISGDFGEFVQACHFTLAA